VSEAKPFAIPKQLVWDAYQRVKANRGAAGVDGVSLAAFETDLKNNLYKVWNRTASGLRAAVPAGLERQRGFPSDHPSSEGIRFGVTC
jgi:RNA-directed DNA polymerase